MVAAVGALKPSATVLRPMFVKLAVRVAIVANIGISDSAYYCRDCEFTIHESCSEIPQCVEQHPLHPQHRLRFCDVYEEFQEEHNPCDACGYLIQGFSLMCGSCQCFFHVPCVEATPRSLKHKCHKHNLFYFTDVNAETWFCDCCNLYLSGSYYGCVSCGIRLHLQCVPIPKIVEHKCHWHPLTLVDSIVEDDYSKGCYCDVCNRPLYLKHHVYKCKKCRFFAHIECIVSEDDTSLEILSSLNLGFEDKAEQCNDRKENIDDTDGNRIVAIEDESEKTEESEEVQEADADA
ncbi:hypothetical protein Patl1_23132 [Pistacia atlantica]|uniref:Uncharacterized protein n=1 Tax=Pistacia atlantica TaxID=434234 RepID=A0ACC0ZVT6_9ROSI|nr:hypothetical protein Patl1_23132 [Pistacia atlantica]